jgi:excisionase family DNA binding protein
MKSNPKTKDRPRRKIVAEPGQVNPGTGQIKQPKPRHTGNGELLATRQEMAAKLGWSVRSLDRMVKARVVPHVRAGRLVRFDPGRVMAALHRNCEIKEVQA